MRDPIVEFMTYNQTFARRNPELLRLKVARMAEGPFAFFRGTFHLYAHDLLAGAAQALRPDLGPVGELDLVGDIHSENFGTYKAADGLIHYDINDFDETTHGRFDLDVLRVATSWFLAARDRGDALEAALTIPLAGVRTYVEVVQRMIKKGKDHGLDVSESAPSGWGPVDDLVAQSAAAKRTDFIHKLTDKNGGQRRLLRSSRYFNLPDDERAQALRLLEDYRRRMPEPAFADFYKVEDVCGRVSGIGSMGRLRYVVLLNGKGSKEARNVLVEFKEAFPSAYDIQRQRETDPAARVGRAERVVGVQRQSQAACSPYLGFAVDGTLSFQAREVAPHDARVDTKALKNTARLQAVAQAQASILARTHARAAARAVGVRNPLAEVDDAEAFCQRVLAFVLAYADVVARDWKRFVGHRDDLDRCEQWAADAGPSASGLPTGPQH
jgi:uncharacterized protein (DUF2252 family)